MINHICEVDRKPWLKHKCILEGEMQANKHDLQMVGEMQSAVIRCL
jgi:hypothetical protein